MVTAQERLPRKRRDMHHVAVHQLIADCKQVMPASPQEVMIGNLHPVADTTAAAMAHVARAAGACAAGDMSGSHCNVQVTRYDKTRLCMHAHATAGTTGPTAVGGMVIHLLP